MSIRLRIQLTDHRSGALELHQLGAGDNVVGSLHRQTRFIREIVYDRADNAAQPRLLFQDELEKLSHS